MLRASVACVVLACSPCPSPSSPTQSAAVRSPVPASLTLPEQSPKVPAPAESGAPAPVAAPLAQPDDRTCFLAEELANPYHPDALAADPALHTAGARERLLPAEQAEALAGPLAWRAFDAIVAGRYERLARLLSSEGLCLRAAKGADCIQLTTEEVKACGRSRAKRDWPIDSGDDGPYLHTCAEAMKSIFLPRHARRPTSVTHNCFPPPGRGNNADPILVRPASAFVEFHFSEEPWLGLWFVFDTSSETSGSGECPGQTDCTDHGERLDLVELTAEYWGI